MFSSEPIDRWWARQIRASGSLYFRCSTSLIVPEITLAPCDAKDAGDRRQREYDRDQDDGGVAFHLKLMTCKNF
jgi:hypothetical protein